MHWHFLGQWRQGWPSHGSEQVFSNALMIVSSAARGSKARHAALLQLTAGLRQAGSTCMRSRAAAPRLLLTLFTVPHYLHFEPAQIAEANVPKGLRMTNITVQLAPVHFCKQLTAAFGQIMQHRWLKRLSGFVLKVRMCTASLMPLLLAEGIKPCHMIR